jgi:hypothetical protein
MVKPWYWSMNIAYKTRHKTLTYEDMFLGELLKFMKKPNTSIARVNQISKDKIEIVLIEPYYETFFSFLKFDSRVVFKKIVVDREKETTQVLRYNYNTRSNDPYVNEYDIFYYDNKNEEKKKAESLTQVRHIYWLNPFVRQFAKYEFLYLKLKNSYLFNKYKYLNL